MFIFSKCFPTHSSNAQTDAQQEEIATPMTTLSFARPFIATAATAEQRENTEPYCYIKEGNVEKLLEALRDHKLHPGHAWELAIKYSTSPALYLFAIEKLPMEDLKEQIVAKLKEKNIQEDLLRVMGQSYAALANKSQRELRDHDGKIFDTMVQMQSLFRLAIVPQGQQRNDKWSDLYDAVSAERTTLMRLHKPEPTLLQKLCCLPMRAR